MIVNYKLILLFFNEKKNYVCCLQLDYVNSSFTLLIETKFITQTKESMCLSMKDNLHTTCIQYSYRLSTRPRISRQTCFSW